MADRRDNARAGRISARSAPGEVTRPKMKLRRSLRWTRWANTSGFIVLILSTVSLLVLLGDIPRAVPRIPIDDPEDTPSIAVIPGRGIEDVMLSQDSPMVSLLVRPAILPWKRPDISGTVEVSGAKRRPGRVAVDVLVLGNVTQAEGGVGDIPKMNKLPVDTSGSLPGGEASVSTSKPCEGFTIRISFHISSRLFSFPSGWARQRLLLPIPPNPLPAIANQTSQPRTTLSSAGTGCDSPPGTLGFHGVWIIPGGSNYDIVKDLSPAPAYVIEGNPVWKMPEVLSADETPMLIQATVENRLVRFLADLAPQMLFVAVGALLATARLRRPKPVERDSGVVHDNPPVERSTPPQCKERGFVAYLLAGAVIAAVIYRMRKRS